MLSIYIRFTLYVPLRALPFLISAGAWYTDARHPACDIGNFTINIDIPRRGRSSPETRAKHRHAAYMPRKVQDRWPHCGAPPEKHGSWIRSRSSRMGAVSTAGAVRSQWIGSCVHGVHSTYDGGTHLRQRTRARGGCSSRRCATKRKKGLIGREDREVDR